MSMKILVALVLLAMFSFGCAEKLTYKAVESVIEKETGEEAKVNTDKGTLAIETKEGKVNIGTDELPEGADSVSAGQGFTALQFKKNSREVTLAISGGKELTGITVANKN